MKTNVDIWKHVSLIDLAVSNCIDLARRVALIKRNCGHFLRGAFVSSNRLENSWCIETLVDWFKAAGYNICTVNTLPSLCRLSSALRPSWCSRKQRLLLSAGAGRSCQSLQLGLMIAFQMPLWSSLHTVCFSQWWNSAWEACNKAHHYNSDQTHTSGVVPRKLLATILNFLFFVTSA